MKTVALIGNPNCGKSTLFNRLTGTRQKVGNWPGVTVAKKQGRFDIGKQAYELLDLPGLYSLTSQLENSADEEITTCALRDEFDYIINVIDANHIERHLYLTAQLLEYQIPMVVVLNMTDVAKRRGIDCDVGLLSERLGCPVVMTVAHTGVGVDQIRHALTGYQHNAHRIASFPDVINRALSTLQEQAPQHRFCDLLHLLEGDLCCQEQFDTSTIELANTLRVQISEQGEDADTLIIDARYRYIHELCLQVINKLHRKSTKTSRIDQLVLHRYFGIPIFLLSMYLTFIVAINFGSVFQDFFALTSQALFIDLPVQYLKHWHAPTWLILTTAGVGMGVHTTVTFIPILFMLFFMLSILESTGYMARAAFVMDRLMSYIGLPGKAFLPLIIGFGCNVPAIMATRTLDSKRERIITILMSPFMSCSARLAVFSVFVAAFFPSHGALIIFSLYVIGILCAILTGFILSKTLLQQRSSPLVFELPAYHAPNIGQVSSAAYTRLKSFLIRAGRIIVPVCVVLTLLDTLKFGDSNLSLLALFGQLITPLFTPIGISADNWPATVGLLTGTVAKEVLIGSLNTMYNQLSQVTTPDYVYPLGLTLKQALWSIPHNLRDFIYAFINPIAALAPHQEFDHGAYGEFVKRFHSPIAAYAYCLFVLLYIPCVSTFAVTVRELNWRYAVFGLFWSVGIAYFVAASFYQLAHFSYHPVQSMLYCLWGIAFVTVVMWFLKRLQVTQMRAV